MKMVKKIWRKINDSTSKNDTTQTTVDFISSTVLNSDSGITTTYYTTINGRFVENSLSSIKWKAENFYHNVIQNGGKVQDVKVLKTTII